MKLLSRQELQNQLSGQKQVSLDRLAFIEEQTQAKLTEYNDLDRQYELKKIEIEKSYDSILESCNAKRNEVMSDITRLESQKEKLNSQLAESRIEEREQEIRSRQLDLNNKQDDHTRREQELEERNKEHAVKMAELFQLLADVEGKKAELAQWEETVNKKNTELQDKVSREESRIGGEWVKISDEREKIRKEYELLEVEKETAVITTRMLEDGKKELDDMWKKFRSQANTLEALYLDLKRKGHI